VLRLRTPNTTINGNPAVKTLDQPLASGFHDIRASFDGQVGRSSWTAAAEVACFTRSIMRRGYSPLGSCH
jgi:hypothetical protein